MESWVFVEGVGGSGLISTGVRPGMVNHMASASTSFIVIA